MPSATQIHFKPGMEVHCDIYRRYANVAQIAATLTGRDIHGAALSDRKVAESAAHPYPF